MQGHRTTTEQNKQIINININKQNKNKIKIPVKIHQNTTNILTFCWRFGLYRRPSSEEEAGTSPSGSWSDGNLNLTCQESGRMRDWVVAIHGLYTILADVYCLLDQSTTIHESRWRQLSTQSRIRPLSWHVKFSSFDEGLW